MAHEKRVRRHGGHADEETTEPEDTGTQRREKLEDDVDATLDEIDDVLEENADSFVRAYVQKGGQ